jgi:hypothetical protein
MAKLPSITESWIASILLVMNILRLRKEYLCFFFKSHYFLQKAVLKNAKTNYSYTNFNKLVMFFFSEL